MVSVRGGQKRCVLSVNPLGDYTPPSNSHIGIDQATHFCNATTSIANAQTIAPRPIKRNELKLNHTFRLPILKDELSPMLLFVRDFGGAEQGERGHRLAQIR